jgi:hypothetical protein
MTWYQTYRKNKYNAKSSVYNGSYYHSIKEADYAQELDLRVKAKDIKSWRRQIPFDLKVNGFKICRYVLDFEITHTNGDIELIEVKGMETDLWRFKRRLLEATYLQENPEVKYTVVK